MLKGYHEICNQQQWGYIGRLEDDATYLSLSFEVVLYQDFPNIDVNNMRDLVHVYFGALLTSGSMEFVERASAFGSHQNSTSLTGTGGVLQRFGEGAS